MWNVCMVCIWMNEYLAFFFCGYDHWFGHGVSLVADSSCWGVAKGTVFR